MLEVVITSYVIVFFCFCQYKWPKYGYFYRRRLTKHAVIKLYYSSIHTFIRHDDIITRYERWAFDALRQQTPVFALELSSWSGLARMAVVGTVRQRKPERQRREQAQMYDSAADFSDPPVPYLSERLCLS